MKQATGIPDQNNEIVVTFLNLLLTEEYMLYTKTRTAHWNIDGENYFELHVFLENQYNAIDVIIDDLAEQIRSLGHFATGSLKNFMNIAEMLDENHDYNSDSEQIFEVLLHDHKAIIRTIQHEIYPISHKYKDIGTTDFLTGLLGRHQKMIWMLKSFLYGPDSAVTVPIRMIANQRVNSPD